jgi:hypothetical protein
MKCLLLAIASISSQPTVSLTIDGAVHLPLSQHPISGLPLIQRQRGATAIWGWDIAFVNTWLVALIIPRQFYSSDFSWLHPPHLPHQPPILSTMPVLKSNHLQGDAPAGMKQAILGWDIIFCHLLFTDASSEPSKCSNLSTLYAIKYHSHTYIQHQIPSRHSNIYPRQRGPVKKGEIWHETSSFVNFWLLCSSALRLWNKTTKLYTTTKPHATI